MKHFFDWFASAGHAGRPWIMFGKGPSFDRRHEYGLEPYRQLSLNHVVREGPVDIAHMIDIEVVAPCADAIEQHAGVLAMPWRPHVGNLLGEKTLAQWVDEVPVLKRLDAQGRLLWYDLSTSKQRHGPGPVVRAAAFSAEAALNLLALAGATKIRSLGIDGGNAYGSAFDDLKNQTRLNNGQPSYDLQFQGFARTISSTGVDYAPLDIESPIRVYVGSQEEQMLSVRVLEHSIRHHASMSVQVQPLHSLDIPFPTPKDPKHRARTPFSFQRFTIPTIAGHHGRAIYLDSDMQVFRDIRRLWTMPFDGAHLLAAQAADGTSRRPQFSVMLLDCDALDWTPSKIVELLDRGALSYEQLMHEMALVPKQRAAIPAQWNSLEAYDPRQTCLLHYTDMSTQPWVYAKNRNGHLWVQELLSAIDDDFISVDEVREHVARGWVRPSLLKQVMAQRERLSPLSGYGWFADRRFVAPYRKLEIA
jgi:Glycosyl transferase family 8